MAKKKEEMMVISLKRPQKKMVKLHIKSDPESILHMHRLGKKAKEELDNTKEGKKARKQKPRNYQEEFIDSIYFIDGKGMLVNSPKTLSSKCKYGFPASGFKKAMISAARQFKNVTMAEIKGCFFIMGEYVEIKGKPELEGYWRRIGGIGKGTGTPDWGIRAMFKKWEATLTISYNENMITPESIAALLDAAGMSVGIGEDRPDKTGNTGGMWFVA